jgi:3'-phosphoadenosine 5'-phosphosulfate sulfotransferase (PAPS reductase)/FAD synthetase
MTEPRHILALSGGKDSSALAVYMKDRVENMEYVFCDTGKELPETYEYLAKLEAFLGRKIIRLNADRGFDHWLKVYGGYLPSPRMRWCTRQLKLKPFEDYIGDDECVSYVGIRSDEDRVGYISTKPNLKAVFPFKEAGLDHSDILRLLEESGLGLPGYYKWRTRSGCYFCFFQRKSEWAGLLEHHPELFEESKQYEKHDPETGERYTWSQRESLEELQRPERLVQIRRNAPTLSKELGSARLIELLEELDADDDACTICTL